MIERYPLPAIHDVYLKTHSAGTGGFPTSRIQKGLILELGNRDVSEEGVGFGLPVLKLGRQPIFPGAYAGRQRRARRLLGRGSTRRVSAGAVDNGG